MSNYDPVGATEVLLRKGSLEEFESTVRQAVAKDGQNASICDTLASVLLKRGKTREAAEAIGRARTIAPENWSLALTQARVFMAADRKEEARVLLKEVENHADALPPYLREEMVRIAREWRARR